MKKIFLAMVMFCVGFLCLTGCTQATMKCTFCDEEKVCETKEMMGEEVHICEECMNEMEGL